ncbi:putative signal-transduction protein containing cAMP-binding and CBS domains [Halovivax ruber XH-70]|uniref:Putative signal-transduction protein containing cAMP-binding and CBS domains n=1 Tax=Halovivax ruber (strain DSM 18193 / JCM 13892 / XH-70) TaxID=797302 RepID=L0IDS8_HALRX|nr:CBS domain-containing protein [Halovivax ruber]AGB16988.1 putative signal-transduction protein containing cAMP-binding and CBS domains [Halovivax ruber XH-70]
MEDIFVARLMSSDVYTVGPDTLVEDAATAMLERDIGSVVVVNESNRICGILTGTDFVKIVSERKPKDQTPVSRYMTEDVVTGSAQDTIHEMAELMTDHGFQHVPIVDETEGVIGMLSTTDLTAYLSRQDRPTGLATGGEE